MNLYGHKYSLLFILLYTTTASMNPICLTPEQSNNGSHKLIIPTKTWAHANLHTNMHKYMYSKIHMMKVNQSTLIVKQQAWLWRIVPEGKHMTLHVHEENNSIHYIDYSCRVRWSVSSEATAFHTTVRTIQEWKLSCQIKSPTIIEESNYWLKEWT
jgi:hypothetical protein